MHSGTAISAVAITSFFFEGRPDALVGPLALVMFDETERAPKGKERLRSVNVTVDGPDRVDFLVNGQVVAQDVAAIRENTVLIIPGSVPIPYEEIPKGRHTLAVRNSDTQQILVSRQVNFANRSNNTVYFTGIDGAAGEFGLDIFVICDGGARNN